MRILDLVSMNFLWFCGYAFIVACWRVQVNRERRTRRHMLRMLSVLDTALAITELRAGKSQLTEEDREAIVLHVATGTVHPELAKAPAQGVRFTPGGVRARRSTHTGS